MSVNTKKMKMMKKLMTVVMTVCLLLPCFSLITFAADGEIMFTDPEAKVGETVQVRGVLESSGNGIEDREIVMSYDTSMLKFKNGDHVQETSSGKLTYSVKGQVESDGRVEFEMSFEALKEGTAKITVDSCKAWTSGANYEEINCKRGASSIKIAAGSGAVDQPSDEPSNAPSDSSEEIVINGVTYTFSEEFAEKDIPEGFEKTMIQFAGKDCSVVFSDEYGMYLAYLLNGEGKGSFFIYTQEDAMFSPYVEISISETVDIMLLSNTEGITLPEPYTATTILVNGVDFPAWQNAEKSELCIIYAVNTNGQKSLYQLDSAEGTYQKFEAPEIQQEEEKKDSLLGTFGESMVENLDKYILIAGISFILFLIIIIVLSVKLFNRNAELDELYDEFGIDFGDDEEVIVEKIAKKSNEKKREKSQETAIDHFEEDEDDEEVVEKEEQDEDVEEEELKKEEFSIELEEIKKETDHELFPENMDFFDDDDDSEYEIDFIDLDD